MVLSKSTRVTGLVALVAVLLTALTALQYRWIGELSGFQRQQMERNLRGSTDRFVRDLDGELERIWYVFHARRGRGAAAEIAEDHAEWTESFDFPDLVAEAYWVTEALASPRSDPAAPDRLEVAALSLEDGRLEPMAWPAWLTALREPLVASSDSHRARNFHESDSFTAALDDGRIAFVVAQTQLEPKSWAVVVLRTDVMLERFLPSLVQDHFGSGSERSYEIRIFDEADEGRIIFASASAASADAAESPDLVRHLREFGGVLRSGDGGNDRSLAVAVTHRAGSLDTAVAQLRGRNLAFSFGVVLVLGASVGVLVIAAQRARRLAERQMEFVAGVSHELRTPIAGISSLSQNLADGVVRDLDQAARYGKTIHQESRRLANMVEGVLHFSAIRSGRYRYEMRDVDVDRLVDAALATLDTAVVEKRRLTVDIQDRLPPLHGDERALQTVLRNLVSNAMKFSKEGGEIRLSAATFKSGGTGKTELRAEIELSVEDSGTGIEDAELAHVFEPFFRGRQAQRQHVEGSGLGLSLVKEVVEAHRGRVEVTSAPGTGSIFRVYLPTASPADAPAPRGRAHGTDRLRPAGNEGGGR